MNLDDRSVRDSERKAALMHFNTDQVIKNERNIHLLYFSSQTLHECVVSSNYS